MALRELTWADVWRLPKDHPRRLTYLHAQQAAEELAAGHPVPMQYRAYVLGRLSNGKAVVCVLHHYPVN